MMLKKVLNIIHVGLYRLTGGLVGGRLHNMNVLVLTTTGRKTRKQRDVTLLYAVDGKDFIVVASNGGAPTHPAWYGNMEATPQVDVQIRYEKMKAVAHTATAEERPRLWELMVSKYPDYATYQRAISRVMPVVVLRPQ